MVGGEFLPIYLIHDQKLANQKVVYGVMQYKNRQSCTYIKINERNDTSILTINSMIHKMLHKMSW